MIFEGLFLLINKIFFLTSYVDNKNSFPMPLNEADEAKYIALAKSGDREAKDTLAQRNLRLVAHIAKKYSNYNDQDELISVGSIGLIKAINCYEPNKGTTLATYAAKCIENEMLMVLRSGKKHNNNISINDVIGTDKDGNTLSLKDIMIDQSGDVEDAVSYRMGKERLIKVLKELLDEREYKIMKHRYGLEGTVARTQKEVAVALGISRSYVSRIEKKVIGRLRGYFRDNDIY